jgi:hypothetical protein
MIPVIIIIIIIIIRNIGTINKFGKNYSLRKLCTGSSNRMLVDYLAGND